MPLAIFTLRQSAQPPRLEMPTPQRSDRFSLMQPEPSHPASSPMTSGQDKIAPPQLTTSRARNGRLRSGSAASFDSLIGRGIFPVRLSREFAQQCPENTGLFEAPLGSSGHDSRQFPVFFPVGREWRKQRPVRSRLPPRGESANFHRT